MGSGGRLVLPRDFARPPFGAQSRDFRTGGMRGLSWGKVSARLSLRFRPARCKVYVYPPVNENDTKHVYGAQNQYGEGLPDRAVLNVRLRIVFRTLPARHRGARSTVPPRRCYSGSKQRAKANHLAPLRPLWLSKQPRCLVGMWQSAEAPFCLGLANFSIHVRLVTTALQGDLLPSQY